MISGDDESVEAFLTIALDDQLHSPLAFVQLIGQAGSVTRQMAATLAQYATYTYTGSYTSSPTWTYGPNAVLDPTSPSPSTATPRGTRPSNRGGYDSKTGKHR